MATFRPTIKKEKIRADKTWNVLIRLTHNRQTIYLPTSIYVTKQDLTTTFKIKNQRILDKCEDIIRSYRKKIEELDLDFNDFSVKYIADFLKRKDLSIISFSDFADEWISKHQKTKGLKNYKTAINSFKAFMRKDSILCDEITVKTMRRFEEYLEGKTRAQSLYTNCIVKIFEDARDFYNDEDNGIIRIKRSLRRYTPPKQNVAEKRALELEQIRSLFKLPYNGHHRHDLALDCYKLSFCLMGMNSADLFNAKEYDGEFITYNRTKTKDRRSDAALMVVKVHHIIKPLMKKYSDNERVFNFHKMYKDMSEFNRALNIGLKEVGEELDIEHLQFYSARHSFATIAVNDANIPIYTVNDMLCHIDNSMKITMLYIKKKFEPMNEANSKFLDFVFTS